MFPFFLRAKLRRARGQGSCLQPLPFFGLAPIHADVKNDSNLLPFRNGIKGNHSVIDRKDDTKAV